MWLYRVIFAVAAFPLAALFAVRTLRGREDLAALRARLGVAPAAGDRRPTVWLHAASNGELASVAPLVARLRRARPDLRWFVTANSVTGRDLARGWGVAAECAPLDLRGAARRLLRRWDVRLHIVVESEFWPNRLSACGAAGVPVAVLGARMSARTARGWARLPGLAPRVLGHISFLSAQDARSLERLRALGLPEAAAGPVLDLKALYTPPPGEPDGALQAAFPRAGTWLAASTHDGEEDIVIAAHLAARAARPGLRLILAPRHPARGDAVAALLAQAGIDFDRRSRGEVTGAEVLLADTMGEMHLWYALAGTVFVGGSLVPKGGHTPYEPAAFGCALLHGPHLENFAPAYGRIAEAGASRRVSGAGELAGALSDLAAPDAQTALGQAGAQALGHGADAEAVVAAVQHMLPPAAKES